MQKRSFGKDYYTPAPGIPDSASLSNACKGPYHDPILNIGYEMLFCDRPLLYRSEISIPFYPWDVIFNDESSNEQIQSIFNDASLPSRARLIACQLLAKRGFSTIANDVLGIVVEINLKHGTDVLAVYADGTARYMNHKEKQMIWETNTPRSEELILRLFNGGRNSFNKINLKAVRRGNAPNTGKTRISFLRGTEIISMEADMHIMRVHEYSSEVMKTAIELMLFLTDAKFRKYGIDTKKAVFKDSGYLSSN